MKLAGNSTEQQDYDDLVLGGQHHDGTGTLASGTLVRGTVLGRITASGDLVQSVQTATNGSQQAIAVLMHDADASGSPQGIQYYDGGDLNATKLIWDASWTAALQLSAFDGTTLSAITPA